MAAAQGGIGEVRIRVEPAVMVQKAQTITSSLKRIQQEFADMTRAVERTTSYWNGEAAELYRSSYKSRQSAAEAMFTRIQEHATDLQNIAQVYTQAETRVTDMATALPKDAIV